MGEEKLLDKLTEEISMQSLKKAKWQWEENEKRRDEWKMKIVRAFHDFFKKKLPRKTYSRLFWGFQVNPQKNKDAFFSESRSLFFQYQKKKKLKS